MAEMLANTLSNHLLVGLQQKTILLHDASLNLERVLVFLCLYLASFFDMLTSFCSVVIQDGPQAGQTVPHVHIHVLPRKAGDFEKNDEIYDAIEVKEKELQQKLDLDKERKDRSLEEMNQEADQYRSLFL